MKTRQISAFLAGMALTMLSGQALAQYDTWESRASYPFAITSPASEGLVDKFYVISGVAGCSSTINGVYAYSTATDSWEEKASIPTPRAYARAGTIDGKIYVVGGCINADCRVETTNALEMYDPDSNTWTTRTPMPTPRSTPAVGVIDGMLYVAGGGTNYYNLTNVLEVYDPITNTWDTSRASLPINLAAGAAGVIAGKLYVVGGGYDSSGVATNRAFRYDPGTDSWSELSPMPTARHNGGAGVIDGKLYVAGGNTGSGYTTSFEVYDPATNNWTALPPLPTPRSYVATGVVGRTLYVAGGLDIHNTCVATLEAFTPSPPFTFGGLLPPVNTDKPFKLGSTIPLKFELKDRAGNYITDAVATILLQKYSNEEPIGDPIDGLSTSGADTGNTFRYSAVDNLYIFNLTSKGLSDGTWKIRITINGIVMPDATITIKR